MVVAWEHCWQHCLQPVEMVLSIAPQTASRNHQWLNTSFVPSRFSSLSCHWPAWHLCTHNDIKGSPPSKFTFQVAQRTLTTLSYYNIYSMLCVDLADKLPISTLQCLLLHVVLSDTKSAIGLISRVLCRWRTTQRIDYHGSQSWWSESQLRCSAPGEAGCHGPQDWQCRKR
jgi:hypothetical protein